MKTRSEDLSGPTPFDRYHGVVRSEWIDGNGHLNMGYYLVAFDQATDAWLAYLGLSATDCMRMGVTTFTLEAHVNYLRELRDQDPLRVTTRLIGFDAKRIHYFHQMYHEEDGFLAATNELLSLHVSREVRRATPMSSDVLERLAHVLEEHAELPVAPQVGRRIGLDERPPWVG